MIFYTGTHMINHAQYLPWCMISVNRLIKRKSDFKVNDWIMDSGAYTNLVNHGEHIQLEKYIDQINRWKKCGDLNAAITQDYMCEPFVLAKTGKTIFQHQALTVERYALLRSMVSGAYIMPVLQGFKPQEYVAHVRHYGKLLKYGQWVGVGSVCKRNANIFAIRQVLGSIKKERPDLKLHGFGLKLTALSDSFVRKCLWSSDSMAWSFAARKNKRNANALEEAVKFSSRINNMPIQKMIFITKGAAK